MGVPMVLALVGCQPTDSGEGGAGGESSPQARRATQSLRPAVDVNTIVYNMEDQPREIDPATNTALGGGSLIQHVFEGLTFTGPGESVVPGVAERWDVSEDGLTYDFYLRNDAKWSDGEPVTAHDFFYAWKRVVTPATAAQYANLMYGIEGAEAFHTGETDDPSTLGFEAVTDHHFRVRLARPISYFMQLTAFPVFVPVRQDVIEAHPNSWANSAETYVGNGAFMLTGYERSHFFEMVPNPHYWNRDSVKIERLRWLMITDPQSEYTAYRTNQLDVSYGIPLPDAPEIRRTMPEHMHVEPMVGIYYASFNCERPPFDDVRVRRAFNLVIDRETIANEVTEGLRKPAFTWVPEGIKDADGETEFCEVTGPMFPPLAEAREEAQRLLAEAGYPNGEGFPATTYLYNTHDDHRRVAERLQVIWERDLGVKVELANEEWQVFLSNRREGNFQIARGGWIGDYADPMTFLHIFMSDDGNNNAGYKSPEYDAMMNEAMNTADKARYFELCHQAERLLMDNAAGAPIWYYSNYFLSNPAVEGLMITPTGDTLFHDAHWNHERLRAAGVEVGG
jgi:oligopeptide transport system substrate-binding protein